MRWESCYFDCYISTKGGRMSCQWCKHYVDVGMYCLRAHFVINTIQSAMCDDFEEKEDLPND